MFENNQKYRSYIILLSEECIGCNVRIHYLASLFYGVYRVRIKSCSQRFLQKVSRTSPYVIPNKPYT